MHKRKELQLLLEELLIKELTDESNRTLSDELDNTIVNSKGRINVYYQPPASVKMQYPAIVYSRSNIVDIHADNLKYKQDYAYDIIVIDYVADSEIVATIAKLPYCRFNRHYVSDNLYHDSFTIYY